MPDPRIPDRDREPAAERRGGVLNGPVTLRPYQHEAIAAVEREHAAGRRRTLLVMATGTGKTTVFAEWARMRVALGRRLLVIAHRTELLEQAAARMSLFGLRAAIEQADRRAGRAPVVVASVQTLRGKRLAAFDPGAFDIVIDEAHHTNAAGYRAIVEHFRDARVLGVTATPDRGDGQALGDVFESCAFRYEIREAIAAGFLAPIRCKQVNVEGVDLSSVKTRAGDLAQDQLSAIMAEEQAVLAAVDALLREAGDRKTIVFCVDVAHATAITDAINRFREGAARVGYGELGREERAVILDDYREDKFQYLVNCLDDETEILSTRGWVGIDDIADAETVATMNRTTSALEWQPVSRVVRRARAADERMVSMRNQTLDVRVTEGHRMVVGVGAPRHWEIAAAGTLPARRGHYELPIAAFGSPAQRVQLSLDECRFIGLFITDGSLDRKGGRGLTIVQSTRFDDSNIEIRRLLTACRFDWSATTRNAPLSSWPQNVYRIPKGNIGGALRRRGFARLLPYLDKHLAPALLSLDREQARALFEGVWLGDGIKRRDRRHRNGRRRSWEIVNTDKVLLDRLQWLAVTRGFGANISAPRKNGPLGTKPIYTLIIRDRASVRTNNHTVPTSGGNPAVFEDGHRDERVWCVTTPNGTIITRRRGRALVMGQCQLWTEGFDEPSITCVATMRPTKSRALVVQCVGRGTRLFPGKVDLLWLDFVGNAGKHKLVGPLDALAAGDVPDDVRREAERLLAEDACDVDEALDEAARLLEERRRAAKVTASARYFATEVDPFFGAELGPPCLEPWANEPATTEQRQVLLEIGLKKLATSNTVTRGEAARIVGAHLERKRRGLCSYKQAKLLGAIGIDAREMTKAAASARIGVLAQHDDWRALQAGTRRALQAIEAKELIAKNGGTR